MTPYVRPFFFTHHSSRCKVVGIYKSPLPTAQMTPWVAIRCQTSVEKEEVTRAIDEIARLRGLKNGRKRGRRMRKIKMRGAEGKVEYSLQDIASAGVQRILPSLMYP